MSANSPYDAILFLSFGGPEGMDDVMPFLANVLRGKNVPESRMREVAHHYELFGGVSPINAQNRKMIKAMQEELARRSIDLPIYFGNRNWHPLLPDTLKEMKAAGKTRILTFVTSAYSSYSSCRQYLEDIEKALAETGLTGEMRVDKIEPFWQHPLFLEANVDCVKKALASFDEKEGLHIAFTAHSIPLAMADNCRYASELESLSAQVAEAVGVESHKLVYQSRSGPPTQPWLTPDILDHMREVHEKGVSRLLIHPIGFVSDHMEIIYDLDTEARQLADELGMTMVRSLSSGNSASFAQLMGSLVEERLQSDRRVVECAPGCCAYTPTRPAPQTTR